MTNPSQRGNQPEQASVRRRERPRPISSPIEERHGALLSRAHEGRSSGRPDYEVGYGKPPKHSQFQPGQSGNPRGRPKGAKSPFTLLREELQSKVMIKENGRLISVTKLHAIMKRVVADTLGGKASQTKLLFTLLHIFEAQFATESEPTELSPKDQELVRALLQGFADE